LFDGAVENWPALLLLMAAVGVSLPATLLFVLRPAAVDPVEADPRGLAAFGAAALALTWMVLVPLNVLGHATGDPMVFLFGSETVDAGVVETLTVLNIFAAAALAALSASRRANPRWQRWGLVALAGGLVFVGLEEISYGQHLFGWRASGVFAEANLQSETNLHNFVSPRVYDLVYVFAGLILVAAALLTRLGVLDRDLGRLGALGAAVRGGRFAAPLVMAAGTLILHEVFEELAEFVFSAALVYVLGRLTHAQARGATLTPRAPESPGGRAAAGTPTSLSSPHRRSSQPGVR
jgi:hypothetical protein